MQQSANKWQITTNEKNDNFTGQIENIERWTKESSREISAVKLDEAG